MVDEQTQASFSEDGPIFLIYLLHWFRRTVTKKGLLASTYPPIRPFLLFMWTVENYVPMLLECSSDQIPTVSS